MMKSNGLLIALIVSLGLNLGAAGMFTYQAVRRASFKPSWSRLQKELDLSDEQVEQFRKLTDEGFKDMRPIWGEIALKRKEAFDLLKESELDTVKLNQLYSEIGDLQARSEIRFFYVYYEEMKVLTPEQKEMYIELFEKKMSKYNKTDNKTRKSTAQKSK